MNWPSGPLSVKLLSDLIISSTNYPQSSLGLECCCLSFPSLNGSSIGRIDHAEILVRMKPSCLARLLTNKSSDGVQSDAFKIYKGIEEILLTEAAFFACSGWFLTLLSFSSLSPGPSDNILGLVCGFCLSCTMTTLASISCCFEDWIARGISRTDRMESAAEEGTILNGKESTEDDWGSLGFESGI